jgi:NADH-quinone oxidoreductase subunit L
MGGLWRKLPVPFWSMVVGAAALAALPLTSGFYSKDLILLTSWDYAYGGPWFWTFAALAAFMTALYSARLIFVVFFGEQNSEALDRSGPNMWGPLGVLAALAVAGGWFGLAPLADVLPDGGLSDESHGGWLPWVTGAIPIAGVGLGYLLYGGKQISLDGLVESKLGESLRQFWFGGWGFDSFYDALVVKPFLALARANKSDVVDLLFKGTAALARVLNRAVSLTQTGRLRWYAANMAVGMILVLLIVLEIL